MGRNEHDHGVKRYAISVQEEIFVDPQITAEIEIKRIQIHGAGQVGQGYGGQQRAVVVDDWTSGRELFDIRVDGDVTWRRYRYYAEELERGPK